MAATKYQSDDFHPYPLQDQRLRQNLEEDRQRHSRGAFHARGARRSQSPGTACGRHRIRACTFRSTMARTGSPFQLNLPVTPITDVAFHKREKELVVATQGRAFCIFDDMPLLYQIAGSEPRRTCTYSSPRMFIAPCAAVFAAARADRRARIRRRRGGLLLVQGTAQGEVTLEFLDAAGNMVRKYSSKPPAKKARRRRRRRRVSAAPPGRRSRGGRGWPQPLRLEPALPGRHHVSGLDHVGREVFAVRLIAPGGYKVRLTANGRSANSKLRGEERPALHHHSGRIRAPARGRAADPQ